MKQSPQHGGSRLVLAKGTSLSRMPCVRRSSWALAIALVPIALTSVGSAAQPPVGLGTADSFAVLGGSTVTNTGPTVVNGDLGVAPGAAITGFPPGTVNGTLHAADAVASQAKSDLTTAYDDAAGRIPAAVLPGDLGGLILTPGVYRRSSSLLLTGDATLNGQGDPNAVFIFQVGSTLTSASNSRILLTGAAQACNVYWQIGSSATLGTNTSFRGNILALASISATTRTTIIGRALARNGAVTLDTNTITRQSCATGTAPPGTLPPGTLPPGTLPPGTPLPGVAPPGGTSQLGNGAAFLTTTPRQVARTVARGGTGVCVQNMFTVQVRGQLIRSVSFILDGRVIRNVNRGPFRTVVRGAGGLHILRARVNFTDGTTGRTINFRFRACAQSVDDLPVTG